MRRPRVPILFCRIIPILEKWQSEYHADIPGISCGRGGQTGRDAPLQYQGYGRRNDCHRERHGDIRSHRHFPGKIPRKRCPRRLRQVYEMNRGDLFAPALDEALLRELVRRGWRAPGYKNFEEFWAGIQEKGGWWDPAYTYEEWERIFRTPSRKFEFYSQTLKHQLEKKGPRDNSRAAASGVEAEGDQLYLPHWEPKLNTSRENEKDYPFHLKMFQPLVFAGSIHANDPYLQDINGFMSNRNGIHGPR